jgi:hypothetical protein
LSERPFSRQISSINSASAIRRSLIRTVHGFVQALGIVHGDANLHVPEVDAPELLTHVGRLGQHAALPVDPGVVPDAIRIDDRKARCFEVRLYTVGKARVGTATFNAAPTCS